MMQLIKRLMPKWGAAILAAVALTACANGTVVPLESPPTIVQPTAETITVPPATLAPTVVASNPTVIPPTASPTAPPATPAPVGSPAPADDFGPAPEIDTEVWLNGDEPLRLADLRGKVVLVDFWTYG